MDMPGRTFANRRERIFNHVANVHIVWSAIEDRLNAYLFPFALCQVVISFALITKLTADLELYFGRMNYQKTLNQQRMLSLRISMNF